MLYICHTKHRVALRNKFLKSFRLIAKGNLAIKAVDGLHIDVKQVNQQTVGDAIDAMVSASSRDPSILQMLTFRTLSWDTLLNHIAGADVDALDAARLTAVLSTSGDSNPEKVRLQEDLQLAESVINKLKSEKIQLNWADGMPIVAYGDGLYAFASSAAQYHDSNLLHTDVGNATSGDELGSIPADWAKQFGPAAALQYQNEIGSIGTSTWQNHDAYQRMATILGGGIVPVLSERYILLALAGGAGAKGLRGLLGELRTVRLVEDRAEDMLTGTSAKTVDNTVLRSPRVGSANKVPDGQHGFNDIVDNYAGDAARFEIPTKRPGGEVIRMSELRQIEGSNNGVRGVFEWIIDEGNLTHRRFIPGGQITGVPNQLPKK